MRETRESQGARLLNPTRSLTSSVQASVTEASSRWHTIAAVPRSANALAVLSRQIVQSQAVTSDRFPDPERNRERA
jgi:hypothetical protein